MSIKSITLRCAKGKSILCVPKQPKTRPIMLKISAKSHTLPISPIRRLVPLAEAAAARGTHIYELNIGQPDIHTPEEAVVAVQGVKDQIFPYSHLSLIHI